ncbi:MAG: hypothetical protein VKM98_02985 [Cyanobacteriota bacterium]|nr:hypothetical protein [Cyanobacteriota bacterium]
MPHRRPTAAAWLLSWLGRWGLRGWKVLVAGVLTCGLAWVWIAMYVYYERFRRRRQASCGASVSPVVPPLAPAPPRFNRASRRRRRGRQMARRHHPWG